MKQWTQVVALAAMAAAAFLPAVSLGADGPAPAKKINVIVVTGGHGFPERPFLAMFEAMGDVAVTHAPQKDDSEVFEDTSDWPYDVIVLYNMTQKISEKRQKNFLALLEKGVGVITLHHALAAFQDWPEFEKIAGGRFHLKAAEVNGVKRGPSGAKNGLTYKVHVEDPDHPVTKGLQDFTIVDETYCRYQLDPKAHVIVSTDEPTSDKAIGWTGTYAKARTCGLVNGHDAKAYENPGFRALLAGAIRWVAGRTGEGGKAAANPATATRVRTWAAPAEAGEKKINVAVVTGGHGFEEKPFMAVFEAMDGVAATREHQKDDSELFEDISAWPYDVIVFYNMGQKISEKRQKNLLALLDKGVGVVATHHCLGAYQDWPGWKRIVGGKFYLKETEEDGIKRPASGYQHDVDFKVHIEDPDHPITKGLADFVIHDETYIRYTVDPKAHVILTTDDPTCEKAIGWTGASGKARTCFLLLGHDSKAYANPNYRTLLAQAIRWAAAKPE